MRNRDLAIGAALLFLLTRKKATTSKGLITTTSPGAVPPPSRSFAAAWTARATALLRRSLGGAAWVPRMASRLGSMEAGLAAGRWIGIESGGDPRAESSLTGDSQERGLAQIMRKSLPEYGLTAADFEAMASARTTDDKHADLAAKIIAGAVRLATVSGAKAPSPEWGPSIGVGEFITVNGIGIGKLRHGLPLLIRELRAQGHLRSTIQNTIRSALTGAIGAGTPIAKFAPSPRLAAFARGKHALTGDPAKDLLLRFLVPAAIVAHGAAALTMGNVFSERTVA